MYCILNGLYEQSIYIMWVKQCHKPSSKSSFLIFIGGMVTIPRKMGGYGMPGSVTASEPRMVFFFVVFDVSTVCNI